MGRLFGIFPYLGGSKTIQFLYNSSRDARLKLNTCIGDCIGDLLLER